MLTAWIAGHATLTGELGEGVELSSSRVARICPRLNSGEGCMSSSKAIAERELAPELNRLWHVRQLFERYDTRSGRGPRARDLGVEKHLVDRVFARDDRTYQGIPKSEVLAKISRVIGCDPNILLLAFIKDLQPSATSCLEHVQAVVDAAVDMTESQRKALVELAKVVVGMTQGQSRDLVRYAKRVIADAS